MHVVNDLFSSMVGQKQKNPIKIKKETKNKKHV